MFFSGHRICRRRAFGTSTTPALPPHFRKIWNTGRFAKIKLQVWKEQCVPLPKQMRFCLQPRSGVSRATRFGSWSAATGCCCPAVSGIEKRLGKLIRVSENVCANVIVKEGEHKRDVTKMPQYGSWQWGLPSHCCHCQIMFGPAKRFPHFFCIRHAAQTPATTAVKFSHERNCRGNATAGEIASNWVSRHFLAQPLPVEVPTIAPL